MNTLGEITLDVAVFCFFAALAAGAGHLRDARCTAEHEGTHAYASPRK